MYIPSYTILLLFAILLGKFATFNHYMRHILICCTTHPTKGRLDSNVNVLLDLVNPYGPSLGTTYQSLGALFQITFSHPSLCVVCILVFHISSKLSIHCFCSPFIFSLLFFSFLEFFRVNCFLVCCSSTYSAYN